MVESSSNYLLRGKAAQQNSRRMPHRVTAFASDSLFFYRTGHCRDVVLDKEGIENDQRQ
jgi:hypothetical protein